MTVALLGALGQADDAAWVSDFHAYLTRKGTDPVAFAPAALPF